MFCAIGVNTDDQLFQWSIEVATDDPQQVAEQLTARGDCVPEQILLIGNGATSPEVFKHWNEGRDYRIER